DGDILINTDSEDEGELYVGCAGGEDVNFRFEYSEEEAPVDVTAYRLNVTGLKGGHSGIDIPLQRGNAIKIFFRLLNAAFDGFGVRLAHVDAGSLRNAIPREAFGTVICENGREDEFVTAIYDLAKVIKSELSATEPDLNVLVEEAELPFALIDADTQVNITKAVLALPNGVIRMSDSMKGLVETSSNLAILKSDTKNKTVEGACLMRSSVDSAKEELGIRLKSVLTLAGARVTFTGAYPGWKPNLDSPILKLMQQVYHKKFGRVPEIKAIHAGLECGILGGKYPNWDMISFGPTIRFPHSPDEKVNIGAVQKFWDFLVATLENIPKK
ncbi:MAG: M20/M25/M40 family metallo-hydrolase, partial [Mariniphaga sp.]